MINITHFVNTTSFYTCQAIGLMFIILIYMNINFMLQEWPSYTTEF